MGAEQSTIFEAEMSALLGAVHWYLTASVGRGQIVGRAKPFLHIRYDSKSAAGIAFSAWQAAVSKPLADAL
eukprot:3792415-Karenia_brevis.AAC.1